MVGCIHLWAGECAGGWSVRDGTELYLQLSEKHRKCPAGSGDQRSSGRPKCSVWEESTMRTSRSVLIACVVTCFSWGASLFGQATSSAISGIVKDTSQAVISGATVSVTNTDTGLTRQARSDTQGRYRIGELQPGTYQVSV